MTRKPNTEVREKILQAAYELFYAQGLKSVSMDDVAEKAGIKKANLFHYYPSKEELILAVFDHGASCMREQIMKRFCDTTQDPIDVFGKMFGDVAVCMEDNDCSRGCFIGNLAQEASEHYESLRKKMSEFMGQWKACLSDYLKAWKQKGFFKKEFQPEEASHAILSAFEGSILFSKAEKDVKAVKSAECMVTRFLKSFKSKK